MLYYVPSRICFPHERTDFQELRDILRELSLTDTLFWCARFSQIMSSPLIHSELAKQNYVLKFFKPKQIDAINRFAKHHGGANNVRIVHRGQLLELMRWALLFSNDKPGDGQTFTEPAIQQGFIKACLIASDIWSARVYKGTDNPTKDTPSLNQIRRVIDCTAPTVDEATSAGRAELLVMEHLRAHYPRLDQQFEEIVGLTLEDYYSCASAISLNYLPREIPSPDETDRLAIFREEDLWQPAPNMQNELLRFVDVESQTIKQLRYRLWEETTEATPETCRPFDYRALRDRPILRSKDGRHIILDSNFMSDKLTVGPLFHISNALRASKIHNSGAIFQSFGYAFEDYARSLLESVYGKPSDILVNRLSSPFLRFPIKRENYNPEISDGCLNDVSNLVLFELKARWIGDEHVYSDNPEDYLAELMKKAGEGTKQLALAVQKLESSEWKPVDQDLAQVKTVLPVLVVYDRLLEAIGHSAFLAKEFIGYFGGDENLSQPWFQQGAWKVSQLTVMAAETLELLQTSLKQFTVVQLLRDYNNAHPDRTVSLSSYLRTSKYKNHLKASSFLAKNGLRLIARTQKRIFNENEDED